MKICFASNSGGHLNQLLQLKSLFNKHNYFFITDRNSFSEELAKIENVFFVQKFIFKEVIKKFQIIRPIINLIQSIVIIYRERPSVLITSGAAVATGAFVAAKLFGIKMVFIESIARTEGPSTFGKYLGKSADLVLVQWQSMLAKYKKAEYAGLIFNFSDITFITKKIENIFITVGTYQLQFDRIFREMDALVKNKKIDAKVVAQIGASKYIPLNYEYFDYCGQKKLHELVNQSDLVICQGGSGSIMDSLLMGKKVIAVPRLKEFKEFFDDHQLQLVGELERLKLIIAVYDMAQLGDAIRRAAEFIPDFGELNEFGVAKRVDAFIKEKKI